MEILACLFEEGFKQHNTEYYTEELKETKTVRLVSGKNDRAAFQVMLKGSDDFTCSIGEGAYFSSKYINDNIRVKAVIDGLDDYSVEANFIGLIGDDDGVKKADVLLRDKHLPVLKNHEQTIYFDFKIGSDAREGAYNGRVCLYEHNLFGDERLIKILNFQLTIYDVTLPMPKNYRFYLDLWQHPSNIARKHEVELWSDEHFVILEKYIITLANLGQKAASVIASEIPWSGQHCYNDRDDDSDLFEYNMVKVKKTAEGAFVCDYSAVEKYVNLCFKHGIDKEIEVLGLSNIWVRPETGYGKVSEDYIDAIRIRYYDESDYTYKYMKKESEIRGYIKVFGKFLIEKGWINIAKITADEPSDMDSYNKSLECLRAECPEFRFKAAINHTEFIEEFADRIDDFVPVMPSALEKHSELLSIKERVKGKISWYVCCWPPVPNTFIGSDLCEPRSFGYITHYLHLDGFLRWNYTVWPDNPREKIVYRSGGWAAGDTNFVYPSYGGAPLLTLRYKMMQKAATDFEYMAMLKDEFKNEVVDEILAKIMKIEDKENAYKAPVLKAENFVSLDYSDYIWAKEKMLSTLCENR